MKSDCPASVVKMEDETESPMLPDSATHKLPNGETTTSARSSPERGDGAMPSLSPQPAAGSSFYGDHARKAEAISRAVLGSTSLEGNFKNLIASFLRKMPEPGFTRGHLSDSEVADFQQRCALGDRRRNNTDGNNSGNSTNSDGSNDETRDLAAVQHSRSYATTRSPCGVEGRPDGGRYSYGYERRERLASPYQNYLNPMRKMHKLGYDADHPECNGRFEDCTSKDFQSTMEENPLAAMLQKYAVVNGNDRFSMSPQKAGGGGGGGAIPGSGFPLPPPPLNGLPKKRPFCEEMLQGVGSFPPQATVQAGGQSGMALNGYDGGGGGVQDQSVFVCHACSFMARSDDEFQLHLKSHYDYYCQECGYHSRTKGRLDRHMKTFHGHADPTAMNPENTGGDDESSPHNQSKANEPKTFKCRQCGFISYSREEHWSHNKIHIKVEKQLKCQFCSFVTEFKHHLEYHLRNHKGLKPFKCTKCNYSCVNKSMLNSHMKSHTNIYQFRCASCKYATKYSHSLKLHLINKKHVPAVVLNPDGSLPKDGSGNFELMSKRGPPRGPRGPRKIRHPSKSVSPPALMPVFPTNAAAGPPVMPYSSQGNDFSQWLPSMGSQSLGGQPMNGGAMSGGLPPMNMPLSTASVQSLAYPLSLLSQLSSNMLPAALGGSYYPIVDRMAPPLPIQCSFCHAAFSSPHLLAQHVKKEHVERLNSFGVKLEARSPVHETSATVEPDSYHPVRRNEPNPTDDPGNYPYMSSYANPTISGDVVTTSRFSKDHHAKADHARPEPPPLNPQNIKRSNSDMETGERPLDLSGKDTDQPTVKVGAGDPENAHNNVSPSSSSAKGSSAAASRKRSRKGKACKLDMISLTLQDNWEEEVEGSEASSFDSDGQPGHEGPNNGNNDGENNWDWRKESPRPSDAVDGDHGNDHLRGNEHLHGNEHLPSNDHLRGSDHLHGNDHLHGSEHHHGNKHLCGNDHLHGNEHLHGRDHLRGNDDHLHGNDHLRSNDARQVEQKNGNASDQEPVTDSLSRSDSVGKVSSEGFSSSSSRHGVVSHSGGKIVRETPGKEYNMCQHCGMGFRDIVTYSLHMGYHGYNDPFQCNMCGHRAEDPVGFFVHIARVAHE